MVADVALTGLKIDPDASPSSRLVLTPVRVIPYYLLDTDVFCPGSITNGDIVLLAALAKPVKYFGSRFARTQKLSE